MELVIKRFDIVLVNLDPTIGKEISKARPAVVISPDELNEYWATIIIVPLTSSIRSLGFRMEMKFQDKLGQACVDQIRSVDKFRIVKKLGKLDVSYRDKLLTIVYEMFRP